ncbi:YDG/SRA domain-containing protein [Kitasatospora sp. NPDC092286]|uniref:YDG/SRA domain-containing protein n=1 Tax=Kitasatospora sp. NPDC092286 TaxID=3364087 RepID=UPI0037F61A11
MAKVFGHIEGHPVGSHYQRRRELSEAGVHAPLMSGIHGNSSEGADSIVVSGGYRDDEDYGDVIIYTGHGGQENKRQVRDQNIDDPGNAGLVRSELEGNLIRVIRGAKGDPEYSPESGFRYDGLFRVESHHSKLGADGYRIWQFRLVAADSEGRDEVEVQPFHGDEGVHGPVPRQSVTIQRTVRKSAVTQLVKRLHKGHCQMCSQILQVPGGSFYSEGAHIQAIGHPYHGPDVPENILCLCPNCHVLFDCGARYLTDDLRIVDGLTHQEIGALRTHQKHRIDARFVCHHRGRWVAVD